MTSIFYTPAVHTKDFKSIYTVYPGEEIIETNVIRHLHFLPYHFQWRGSQNLSVQISYCIFFTNFGRIFHSQKNIEPFQLTETLDNGYATETYDASVSWNYDQQNNLYADSTFKSTDRARNILKEINFPESSCISNEPVKLKIELLTTATKINLKKIKTSVNETTLLNSELIEQKKKNDALIHSIEYLHKNYIDDWVSKKVISIDEKIESVFKKFKELADKEYEIKKHKTDLEDWLAYKKMKIKLRDLK